MGSAFSLLLSKFNCGRAACAISGPLRKRVSGSFRQPKETGLTLSHLCVLHGDLNQMEEDLVRGGPAGWTFASASSGMPGLCSLLGFQNPDRQKPQRAFSFCLPMNFYKDITHM